MISSMMLLRCISSMARSFRHMTTANNSREHLVVTSGQPRQLQSCSCEVVKLQTLTPQILGITLKPESKGLTFKPGQWVDFAIPGCDIVGGYSMCSPPNKLVKKGVFDLAVKDSTWPPTKWIHTECKIGSRVEVRVGGDFIYDPEVTAPENLLLIAGGVGINPLQSMLTHFSYLLEERKIDEDCKAFLLYSAGTSDELLFMDQMDELYKKHSQNISYKYFISRENVHVSNFMTDRRINNNDIQNVLQQLKTHPVRAYICGPPPMIVYCQELLRKNYVPDKNIYYENWW